MSGQIIQFRSQHELRKSALYREQGARRARLQGQIARIGDLLEELEDITRGVRDVPKPALAHARATIEKARRILKSRVPLAENFDPDHDEGDPQPELDHEALEHLFRDRNPTV